MLDGSLKARGNDVNHPIDRTVSSRLQELNARMNEVMGLASGIESRLFGDKPPQTSPVAQSHSSGILDDIDNANQMLKGIESVLNATLQRL